MLEATRGKSAVYSVRLGGGGHCGTRKVTSEKDIAENPEISWQLPLFRPLNHYTITLQRYDGTILYPPNTPTIVVTKEAKRVALNAPPPLLWCPSHLLRLPWILTRILPSTCSPPACHRIATTAE